MIEVQNRELTPSQITPIQMWLIQESGLQLMKVLASKVAAHEAAFINDCIKWNVDRACGKNEQASEPIPPTAKSNLSLATRYQIALDVLNEMAGPKATMSHTTLKLPYA